MLKRINLLLNDETWVGRSVGVGYSLSMNVRLTCKRPLV